jgi:lambda family phage holin
MKMHNDPHSWTEFIELLHSWWRGDTPMGAVLLSIVMAVLRIAYGGGGAWKKDGAGGLMWSYDANCSALNTSIFLKALQLQSVVPWLRRCRAGSYSGNTRIQCPVRRWRCKSVKKGLV